MLKSKLLIFASQEAKLYFLQLESCNLSSISLPHSQIYDITWTHDGNILYTTRTPSQVVLITESGKVINKTAFEDARYLSITNSVVYLADFQKGFYKSTNGGKNWMFMFKPQNGWNAIQIIKVTEENFNNFWAIEMRIANPTAYRLRIYNVDKGFANEGNVTWRDLNVSQIISERIFLRDCKLFFDGYSNVFLYDNHNQAVYMFSADGRNVRQILSSNNISNPYALAVERRDEKEFWLFVGMKFGVLGVFNFFFSCVL